MNKQTILTNLLARVEALIVAATDRTMKTAELKAAAADLRADNNIPYDATHGLWAIVDRNRTYDKIASSFKYSRTMLINAIEKEAETESVDQLRVEGATLPEAKRLVRQHGESAFEDWQHHRALLADAVADTFRFAICDTCEGFGKVDNPAFANGFTSSEWAQMPEDEQGHYLNGDYDVRCPYCKGSGKVKIPDVSRMGWPLKREVVRQRIHNRIMAELARESAMERAMGC